MKLCSACSRHYWETEACCPFCGPESWGGTSTAATVLGVTLAAGVALLSCGGNKGDTTTDNGGSYYAGPTTEEYGTSTTTDGGGSYYAGPTTNEFTSTGPTDSSSTTNGADSTSSDGGGSYYAGPSTDDFGSSSSGTGGTSTGMG